MMRRCVLGGEPSPAKGTILGTTTAWGGGRGQAGKDWDTLGASFSLRYQRFPQATHPFPRCQKQHHWKEPALTKELKRPSAWQCPCGFGMGSLAEAAPG